jgi:anti-sigma factor RsiW
MSQPSGIHLSAERMQAFLEGDLPVGERGPVEKHLATCARCSAELEGWRVLFADLSGLGSAAPRVGFADRVMERVQVPVPVKHEVRQKSWLAAFLPSRSAHVTSDLLQDVADGLVPARRVARIRAHVDACHTCTRELESWQGLVETLRGLDRFAPGQGFAARVMAAVRARVASPAPVRVAARTPAWTTVGARALVLARRFVPRTRRQWAAISGVAVTPMAIFGLVAYVVFSHPTLTPQALGSFALWQLGDLFAAAWSSLSTTGLELASAVGGGSLIDLLAGSPVLLAGGAIAYSALAVVALRFLYKNLTGNRSYARASTR